MRWLQLRGATIVLAVLVALPCFAQIGPPPEPSGGWVLGLAAQTDQESADSLLGTFNWGVTKSTWVAFAAGRSTSPAELADVRADTLRASVDHDFGTVGAALEIESWGDDDALDTDDVRGTFYVDGEQFRVSLSVEKRDIDIPFTLTGPLGRTLRGTASSSADGLGIDVRVSPATGWQIYVGLVDYDYERDLGALPRIQLLNRLSASTQTLANSFLDHRYTLSVEREIHSAVLTVGYARDKSAVDGTKFATLDASLLFPVGGRFDLEVTLGSGRSDLLDSGLYAGVMLLIYGR